MSKSRVAASFAASAFLGRRHLLAEIGEARRFRRAEQITRLAGLDPVVDESGETRRRGHLAKAGSPHLRWALVEAAVHAHRSSSPDLALYRATRERRDTTIISNRVAIMYLGRIVETGPTQPVFESPQHPYTAGLRGSHPV